MKTLKLALLCILLSISLPALAQEATITSPPTPIVATKYLVKDIRINRDTLSAVVTLQMAAASGQVLRDNYEIVIESFTDANPDPEIVDMQRTVTDLQAFWTAMETVRATETGSFLRKRQFRVLGYLADSGRLTGVSLAP
jgi:hypothetical protein